MYSDGADSPTASARASAFGVVRRAPGWVLLGLLGSILVTVAGAGLTGGVVRWWFHPTLPPGGETNRVALYLGMAALAVAWLGLGPIATVRDSSPRQLAIVALIWCVPLLAGAPLFSHDVYSYLAQGTIVHLGLSPYRDAPAVLAPLGHARVLAGVDPFWRHVTAPYGPLFLGAVSAIAAVTGSNLVLGAVLVRLLALVGAVLLAAFVPRLARALGADPSRAVWLALLSPLVLLELLAPGHNDLLMAGLLVAGVTFAVERRPLLGIATCALAATIKVPAAAGVLFILVVWAREQEGWSGRLAVVAKAALVTGLVLAVVSLLTGLGLGWISGSVFSTPAKVHLAITPATGVAWSIASLLHGGAAAHYTAIDSVLRVVAFSISVLIGLVLLHRSRLETMPRYLGLALLAFAFGGPAAWPWYLIWGLVLLAACRPTQSSPAPAVAMVVAAFLVKPNGILVLPVSSAPIVVGLYAGIGALAWYADRRGHTRRRPAGAADGLRARARSALAGP